MAFGLRRASETAVFISPISPRVLGGEFGVIIRPMSMSTRLLDSSCARSKAELPLNCGLLLERGRPRAPDAQPPEVRCRGAGDGVPQPREEVRESRSSSEGLDSGDSGFDDVVVAEGRKADLLLVVLKHLWKLDALLHANCRFELHRMLLLGLSTAAKGDAWHRRRASATLRSSIDLLYS